MSLPSSTPLPSFPASQSEQAPSTNLHVFLGDLIKNIQPNASKDYIESYITLLQSLSDNFLARFPEPKSQPWSSHTETLKLTERSLEVIEKVIITVRGVLETKPVLVQTIIRGLVHLSWSLSIWAVTENSLQTKNAEFLLLKEKTASTLSSILLSLGRTARAGDKESIHGWEVLRTVLNECTAAAKDLLFFTTQNTGDLQLTLFANPRVRDAIVEDPLNSRHVEGQLKLHSRLEIVHCVLTLLKSVACVFASDLSCRIFFLEVERVCIELFFPLFKLSISIDSPAGVQHGMVADLFCIAQHFYSKNLPTSSLIPLFHTILEWRIQEPLSSLFPHLDAALLRFVQVHPVELRNLSCVNRIVDILETEKWGDAGSDLRKCLQHCVASPSVITSASVDLLELSKPVHFSNPKDTLKEDRSMTFKDSVLQRLQDSRLMTHLSSLGNSSNMKNEDWVVLFLSTVSQQLSLSTFTSLDRECLCAAMLILLCDAPHPLSPSGDNSSISPAPYIQAWFNLVLQLMQDWRAVQSAKVVAIQFRALRQGIRHFNVAVEDSIFSDVLHCIVQGISAHEREIRLTAGQCLVEYLVVYDADVHKRAADIHGIFDKLAGIMAHAKDIVRETTMITLGAIGRTKSVNLLEKIINILVCQLGHESLLLKGMAYIQLRQLVFHHKKTPYSLLSPFLPQVALTSMANISSKPSMLQEVCRFLSITTEDFTLRTLNVTLPHFVAVRDVKVLERMANELSTTVAHLLLQSTREVLSHIFLLPSSSETTRALAFLVRRLQAAAPTRETNSINISGVVKSCIVPLLVDLVIALGVDGPDGSELALSALVKVEHALLSRPETPQQGPQSSSLALFLKPYMLGVISHMNDVLQDVHGRKSLDGKKQVLRGLTSLIRQVGPVINTVAPQIMATMQSMITRQPLSDTTIQTWNVFVITVTPTDLRPHIGPISAGLVSAWDTLSDEGRTLARNTLDYIILEHAADMGLYLDEVADLSKIPLLQEASTRLQNERQTWSRKDHLFKLLDRASNDNTVVTMQALMELKEFMICYRDWVQELASGNTFDQAIAQIIDILFQVACRDGDLHPRLRLLAYECISILGAVDPDRLDLVSGGAAMIVLRNFEEEGEAMAFALHLIRDVLISAFRSTSDTKFQSHLAFAIQELLKICGFSPDLVTAGNSSSIPLKVRNRWATLPKNMLDTITPLLESKFRLNDKPPQNYELPIYPSQPTYREWLQCWTAHLITKATGVRSQSIFNVFRSAVRNKDVGVARHLLPHLVLNVMIAGQSADLAGIREEITSVLTDQVNILSTSTSEKRLLSAQVIFSLMDHLNKWMRLMRQDLYKRKDTKRTRSSDSDFEEQVMRVESIISSIDEELVAKAAFQCKAYARSLMSFENQIRIRKARNVPESELQHYYDRLHQIYSELDELDGMEGISSMVLEPSIEHQIRHHESLGNWTSAQSCWEVQLQEHPDHMEHHIGLLRCLRSLGHYDTLLTHISGVLSRNPHWAPDLCDFHVEGAMMIGDWPRVHDIVATSNSKSPQTVIANVLLKMRSGDEQLIAISVSDAYEYLGSPIAAAGRYSYNRAYEAVVNLHLVQELEIIHSIIPHLPRGHGSPKDINGLDLWGVLRRRFDALLPSFKTREPVLSIRRVAYGLYVTSSSLQTELATTWLDTAKIARKAKHVQTAFSAILHAQLTKAPFAFVEYCKLIKDKGEPLRALQELENALRPYRTSEHPDSNGVIERGSASMKAKAFLLRAKWMFEAERFPLNDVLRAFRDVAQDAHQWESAHFHLGNYQDQRGLHKKHEGEILNVIQAYGRALRHGSKYVFQTVPRLLTLWLDFGEKPAIVKAERENDLSDQQHWIRIKEEISTTVKEVPVWKWLTAFPQIVSRIGHSNPQVVTQLSSLIATVIQEYPQQALWLFTSVVKSQKYERGQRGRDILNLIKTNPTRANPVAAVLAEQCFSITSELLDLCNHPVRDTNSQLSVARHFPRLAKLVPSSLIVPLQESLVLTLPAISAQEATHQPFPHAMPKISRFSDDIEIMKSGQKPRKISIIGDDGQTYMFLGKPKDDLRKDARLMDFNSIINKLLKKNSKSRKRQLRIRTYGVVTLNEECGLIQWVPNTIPLRHVLLKLYEQRGIQIWSRELEAIFSKLKEVNEKVAAEIFIRQVLTQFPRVFHEWFLATFPEPSAWLASRLAYGRTAAVMSMVGFILGLGDRHTENILLDMNSGDVVHVDFNCLFEKGKSLVTPERVPFRLTQNMVDGLGVTEVEGVFRIASEITLDLLRENQASLMSVLDAFIHDPLVEWEDEKRKKERNEAAKEEEKRRKGTRKGKVPRQGLEDTDSNSVRATVDLKNLAQNALNPIKRKLQCMSGTIQSNNIEDKEMSTSNMVEALIREATDSINLGKAYAGIGRSSFLEFQISLNTHFTGWSPWL